MCPVAETAATADDVTDSSPPPSADADSPAVDGSVITAEEGNEGEGRDQTRPITPPTETSMASSSGTEGTELVEEDGDNSGPNAESAALEQEP